MRRIQGFDPPIILESKFGAENCDLVTPRVADDKDAETWYVCGSGELANGNGIVGARLVSLGLIYPIAATLEILFEDGSTADANFESLCDGSLFHLADL